MIKVPELARFHCMQPYVSLLNLCNSGTFKIKFQSGILCSYLSQNVAPVVFKLGWASPKLNYIKKCAFHKHKETPQKKQKQKQKQQQTDRDRKERQERRERKWESNYWGKKIKFSAEWFITRNSFQSSIVPIAFGLNQVPMYADVYKNLLWKLAMAKNNANWMMAKPQR